MALTIDQAREVARIKDSEILIALGLNINAAGDCQCACPIHDGDNKLGFSYDRKKAIWKCWTAQCDQKYGNDIIGLIRGIKKCTFGEALRFISSYGTIDDTNLEMTKFIRSKTRAPSTAPISFNKNLLEANHSIPLLTKRGFQLKTLQEYQVVQGYVIDPCLKGRLAIPVFDDSDVLKGFTCRRLYEEMNIKWRHYPNDIQITNYIFGLNKAKDSLVKKNGAILVEGPLDQMKLWEYGFHNVISCFGINISTAQIKLLVKYKVHNLALLLDPDKAGASATEKIIKTCQLYFNTVNLGDKLTVDPDETSRAELLSIIPKEFI